VAATRPAALPPADRTVGQLVAESVRFYGDHFRRCVWIGVPPAILAVVTAHVSRTLALVLAPTLYGAFLSASFVYASTLRWRLARSTPTKTRPSGMMLQKRWP